MLWGNHTELRESWNFLANQKQSGALTRFVEITQRAMGITETSSQSEAELCTDVTFCEFYWQNLCDVTSSAFQLVKGCVILFLNLPKITK